MRLIDADAFAEKIKEISDKQGYNTFYTDKQSVGEILHSVVDELTGNTIYGYENCPTVEAISKDQINRAIEKIEQYICDVETNTVKAQGMAQALDMFEQALGGLEDGNDD